MKLVLTDQFNIPDFTSKDDLDRFAREYRGAMFQITKQQFQQLAYTLDECYREGFAVINFRGVSFMTRY